MSAPKDFQPRATIFLGDHLRGLKRRHQGANFSQMLDLKVARYHAAVADLLPKNLTLEDWKAILPILASTSFLQPGDAFLIPLRLKDNVAVRYKLDGLKLPELLAIIEVGQDYLAAGNDPASLTEPLRGLVAA